MKNIILTGATGFVGRYLLKQLLEDGLYVTAIIRSKDKINEILDFLYFDDNIKKYNLKLIESTLEDIDTVAFPEMNYWAWIHLAWGGVNREQINDEDTHKRNFVNSVKCLHKAKELNCEKFIETGSRAECGNEESVIPESMCGEPLNIYGKYKRLFYDYAYNFCKKNELAYFHLRLFSVTGPGDHPWSLVSECCRKFSKNEPMSFGNCEQMWNYIDVRDVAFIVVYFLNTYNIANNDNCIINVASLDSNNLIYYIKKIYEITNSISLLHFTNEKGFDSFPIIEKLKGFYVLKQNIDFKNTIIDMLKKGV